MIRRPPRSTQSRSSAASDVYKRQGEQRLQWAGPQDLGGQLTAGTGGTCLAENDRLTIENLLHQTQRRSPARPDLRPHRGRHAHEASRRDPATHWASTVSVSYTHLRAHETRHDLVCRLLLEKKKKK